MWNEELGFEGNSVEDIIDKLDNMDRSSGYIAIRDNITFNKLKEIRSNPESYSKFQIIKSECKASFDYDRRIPTMYEVNAGLTNLYGIILKLLKAEKDDDNSRFTEIQQSIDMIREQIGMPITGQDKGDTNNEQHNDGKGIETSN